MYKLRGNDFNKILFKKRINRSTLAKEAGISIETLNSWMYRETKATRETAMKVIKYLEIDISDIFDEII